MSSCYLGLSKRLCLLRQFSKCYQHQLSNLKKKQVPFRHEIISTSLSSGNTHGLSRKKICFTATWKTYLTSAADSIQRWRILFWKSVKKGKSASVHHRNIQSLAIEVYKFTRGISVKLMEDIFISRAYNGPILRTNLDLEIPPVNTVYKGDDSLRHLGPLIWQIVPENLRNLNSLQSFKEGIKNWIPYKCPCRLCKEYIPGLGYLSYISLG